jgi:hypothetical protein
MRQLPFFILLALALSLGGCASSTTTVVYARAPDLGPRQEFAPPSHRNRSVRRITLSHHRPSHQVAVLPKEPKDDASEPRPTSTEWWMRENARLGKAIIICRGCLPSTIANASLSKPAVRSSKSEPPALASTSTNPAERSIVVETQDHP